MTDDPPTPAATPWQRLSVRVIWVDLVQSLLSLTPGAIAVLAFDQTSPGTLWPLGLVALFGVLGAVADILRWAFTRFRVTETDVERRTGIFVRRHRTIRRDRIRSVDTHAKLRHRVAGLRVVTIGAGQQTGAGEAALALDALSKQDAALLAGELLDRPERTVAIPGTEAAEAERDEDVPNEPEPEVLATFRPWWVVFNLFSIWAYLTAAGLLWGLFWFVSMFGVDLA
uniref:PH domain-containing protein n=1 Tax=Pseudactinotalea sp. TaxID=1926260 RepID=UPI003B3A9B2F